MVCMEVCMGLSEGFSWGVDWSFFVWEWYGGLYGDNRRLVWGSVWGFK